MKNIFKKFGIFMLFLVIMSVGVLANPNATTLPPTNVDETTVTLNGQLTNLTEANSTAYFYYKTTAATTYTKSATQLLTTNTTFDLDVTSLTIDTDYIYFATVTNTSGTEFNASATETFTTLKTESERNVISGVSNVKTIIYTAISLIALMILVSAAVLIYSMMNGGMDIDSLINITIMGIGGAIILFVGIIIISLVAAAITG